MLDLGTRLDALIAEPDPDALRELLGSLDSRGRTQAKAWFAALPDLPFYSQGRGGGLEDLNERSDVTMLLLLLTLRTPAQALEWIDSYGVGEHLDLVVELVLARDHRWRADFVRVAGALPLRSGWQAIDTGALYRVVCAVCDHDGLDLPAGETLVHGWMAACTPRREWVGGRFEPADEAETLALVRADGRYAERVPHALAHRAIADFSTIGTAVVALVGSGDLDRVDVVTRCLTALDSPGRPSQQKALAGILDGLGLRATEVPGGLARLQQLLATCHGSVTARLLPLAIEALADADDVAELAATIGARPEKKQQTDLLRALTTKDVRLRVGDDAVRAGLEVLADTTDALLAGKAVTALQKVGGSVPASAAPTAPLRGLWDMEVDDIRPPNDRFFEHTTFDDGLVSVLRHAALASSRWPLEPFYEPTALSIVVRWAWQDGVDIVRDKILAAGPVVTRGYDDTWLGRLLPDWLDGSIDRDGEPSWWRNFWARTRIPAERWTPAEPEFAARHLTESLRRTGRIPCLLSTPSRPNGALDLEVLVERLRQSTEAGFGPLDLLQAILRLGPIEPERSAELDGLAPVPPDTSAGTTTSVSDAVAYVRDAIAAGRFPPPAITPERLRDEGWQDVVGQPPADFWLAMLPVDPAELGSGIDELALTRHRHDASTDLRQVAPWCPDLRLRGIGLWRPPSRRTEIPARITESAGPMGVAVHDALLRDYASADSHARQEAVRLTLEAMGRRIYDPRAAITAAAGRLALSRLNLGRCADAWEQVFLAGGIRMTWMVAMTTANLAVTQPRRPPGLADLLSMLTTYVPEVPPQGLLPDLAAFAAERGSTKAHAEAVRLVAAVEARARQARSEGGPA